MILGQSSASTCLSTSKKRPLTIMSLFGFLSAQKSATDIMFKAAERLMNLFPRVPQTDVNVTKLSVSSQLMERKMSTLMIDGSNVSTLHWRRQGRQLNMEKSWLYTWLPSWCCRGELIFGSSSLYTRRNIQTAKCSSPIQVCCREV